MNDPTQPHTIPQTKEMEYESVRTPTGLSVASCQRDLSMATNLCQPDLTSLLDLRRDQADLIYAGSVPDVDDLGNVLEGNIVVALHEHHLLGARLKDVFETALKRIPSHVILVDLQSRRHSRSPVQNLHHDRALWVWLGLLVFRRGLRNESIQALRNDRRDDHEDDQQHQENIDERSHIDIGTRPTLTTHCHCHDKISSKNQRSIALRSRSGHRAFSSVR